MFVLCVLHLVPASKYGLDNESSKERANLEETHQFLCSKNTVLKIGKNMTHMSHNLSSKKQQI